MFVGMFYDKMSALHQSSFYVLGSDFENVRVSEVLIWSSWMVHLSGLAHFVWLGFLISETKIEKQTENCPSE